MAKCTTCGGSLKKGACPVCGRPSANDAGLDDKKARILKDEPSGKKNILIIVAILIALGALWAGKSLYMKKMGGGAMYPPMRDSAARTQKAVAVHAESGFVRIPVTVADDGNAHFFAYAVGDKVVTFFIMKAADGAIKSSFDACMACNHAKLGYRQEGAVVVCNNCGMGFRPDDIGGATGGCNPIVLAAKRDGQMLLFAVADIEAGARLF